MPPGALSRDELIQLVTRILRADCADEREADRLVRRFDDSVAHPEASGLIFWPDRYFDTRHEPTPEEIVDAALAYQPIQLGPADSPPA
jgi:hypothetical protein